jgi:hypothetical protein
MNVTEGTQGDLGRIGTAARHTAQYASRFPFAPSDERALRHGERLVADEEAIGPSGFGPAAKVQRNTACRTGAGATIHTESLIPARQCAGCGERMVF